jgi:hypothetical protein
MMMNTNIIISNKTKYFLIYFFHLLHAYIYGIKVNPNQLYLYVNSTKLLHCLTFLKYNSISNVNSLVDIVVVDNISNVKSRFELTYIF